MITQDEVIKLNQQVQIPLLLTFIGGPVPKKVGSKTDYRFPAWFRDGEKPNGFGITYNYSIKKWLVTDFTGRTFSNYDLLDFMTKILKMPFRKALNELIFASGKDDGYEGIVLPENAPQKLTKPVAIDPKIYDTYEKGLHPYWAKRGFTPEIADFFKLGWSTYGELKDRLTIPIVDEYGFLVSVQGRTFNDRIEPKYKFLEGTGESAKLTLYNYGKAIEEIRNRGWVGVVESANSVWRARQYGYKNFVGTLSTSVTQRQIDLLMRLGVNIVIMFDYDNSDTMAGQIASVALGNELLNRNHQGVYMCNIGFHADPADLTLDQFTMTLKNALHYR